MANKKILFYTNSIFSYGGVQHVLAVIAKALSQDYDVTILTLDKPETKDMSMYNLDVARLTIDFMQYSTLSQLEWLYCKTMSAAYKWLLPQTKTTAGWYAKSSFAPSYRQQLINYIRQGDYDIVIGVHIFLALHLAAIQKQIQAKTIGWMHNCYEAMFEKKNPYIPVILHHFCRHQLSKLDQIIVLSEHDKLQFWNKMQLATIRIYNPLTIEIKGQADYAAKRFLSIGRMENGHKGFDILINAFAEFAKTIGEWKLDLVGEGPLKAEYQKQIDDLGMHDCITIHPFTKYIEDYYNSTSAYILASRWEGMPLVLCEAMAYGHSIIASEIPITRELLADEPFTSLFPVGDTATLAKLLRLKVCGDLQSQGEEARRYVSRFSVPSVIKEWERAIKNASPSR